VARASVEVRYAVDHGSVRRSFLRLFEMLHDEGSTRDEVSNQIRADLSFSVRSEVTPYLAGRFPHESISQATVDRHIRARVDEIASTYDNWVANSLESWMLTIYPVLDPNVWVGAGDEEAGVVDISLVADAIGLNAWVWNLDLNESPFLRIDAVSRMHKSMVILSHLYSLSVPQMA